MSRVIICSNQKGGTGKSTTAINLGIGLAREGKKVLIIDNDAQGSCTAALGYQEPDSMNVTLATIMEKMLNEDPIEPDEGILHHKEGIDLMPANIELAGVEASLVGIMSSETTLRDYVDQVRERYDYIIIDCCPNLGQLTINALCCATDVIIPVQCSFLSVKGLEALLKTIARVRRKINPRLNIMGILLTVVDYRTNYAKTIESLIKDAYGNRVHVFTNYIPKSVKVEESTALGISIYKHDPKGKAAAAYEALVKEVLIND